MDQKLTVDLEYERADGTTGIRTVCNCKGVLGFIAYCLSYLLT